MKRIQLFQQIEELWYNRHRTKRGRKYRRALRRRENQMLRVNAQK